MNTPVAPSGGAGAAMLTLLGAPTLALDSSSHVLAAERRSQLLVWLAIKGGWVGRAEAAALLWPEQDAKLAATNLRKTLFRLQALPWGACIGSQGGALRFEGETDLARFEAALAAGRIEEALALGRGELLAGFDDDANEPWTEWLRFERERQRVAWRGAAVAWLERDEVDGAKAVALAARLLAADALDETALRLNVAWLARQGQAVAARQVHASFVQRLEAELGLKPSAALMALIDGLGERLGDRPDDARGAAAAQAAAARRLAPVTSTMVDPAFIGRGAELRQIASLLEQDDCRALMLVGPGGAGKTRLARRAMQELANGFADGAAFVALEDVNDTTGLTTRLMRDLGLAAADSGGDSAGGRAAEQDTHRLFEHLGARHLLLVLDNCEELAGEAAAAGAPGALAAIAALLEAAPRIKLLITSRVRLALAGAWLLPLAGLPCPDAEDADRLEAFDASRLFVRAAQRVRPELVPAAEAAAIVDICRQVEGLPLAIELAAAWVRVLSCAEIARELRGGTELLRSVDAAQPARHASIEQVFDQSWRHLTESERAALVKLALFRGGFTAQAARAVAGAPLAVLGALADKSLLHRDETHGARLRLHPLVQQLAAARLARLSKAERLLAADAHAAFFLQWLMRQLRPVRDGEREALNQLDIESDNCRLAWQRAATAGPALGADAAKAQAAARVLAQTARVLMFHCDHRGRRQEGLQIGLVAMKSPAALAHSSLRAWLLAACAHLHYRLDHAEPAREFARAALAMAKEEDGEARVQALSVLGGLALRATRLDEAHEHYTQALALSGEIQDPHHGAGLRGNLALVAKRRGRYEESVQLSLAALQDFRRLGNVAGEALELLNLGSMQLDRGLLAESLPHLREALTLAGRHGMRATLGLALSNLSGHADATGDLEAAQHYGERAIAVLTEVGEPSSVAATQHRLAVLAERRGERSRAHAQLAEGMRTALTLNMPVLLLSGVLSFATVLALAGEHDVARGLFEYLEAQPLASAPIRDEAARLRTLHCAEATAPPWCGIGLDELAERLASEHELGYAPLLARLRGRPPA